MTAAPTRSYARLAVAVVITAVVVSASALSYSSLEATVTKTGTTTVFNTSTVISTSTIVKTLASTNSITTTSAGSYTSTIASTSDQSQAGQVSFYRTDGDWNFSVTLSSAVLQEGQPIDAYINVTNISGQTQTVHEVNPIINPVIYSENGTIVWAWDPPQINFITNVTSLPGTSDGPFVIPTSNLSPGEVYTLSIWPFIGPNVATCTTCNVNYEIGDSLMVNATISVTGTTSTWTECTISAEGSGFYVTVLPDSGQGIQGAQVTGTSSPCQQDIGAYVTNSTGSVLITPDIASYFLLSITYQSQNYTVKAPIEPMTTTYVTLRVPSGNVTICEVFEGGCQTSSEGVNCPG